MFGEIISINNDIIKIKNNLNEVHLEFLNIHVIFEKDGEKVVGEIINIEKNTIDILIIGEIKNNVFLPGNVKKINVIPRIINALELEYIIGEQQTTKDEIVLGSSPIYPGFNIKLSINSFFASHNAIIGNTGSGKSCTVARILQNLFTESYPINSHFVIFDIYGEYKNTFENINQKGLNCKKYTIKKSLKDEYLLNLPPYFLDVSDLAILLSVNNPDQLPVLEKTLKLVYIFTSKDEYLIEYKNDIIAKCLLDILTSGKNGSQIRDQIIAILSKYNTDSLNLDTIIKQPGYDRPLKQCLKLDEHGKINEMLLVTEFLKKYEKIKLNEIVPKTDFFYNLNDLYYALEFSLISEGNYNSSESFSQNNILKTRLHSIINSDYKYIFECEKYITKEKYLKDFFSINEDLVQVVNINFSEVDDKFAKIITKLFSKLFFEYTTFLEERGSYPINIMLEEAHRYVQNDNDINIIGYNIFDRITKEGRKYGTFLTFITQRPSELSETALSQCSNFIVLRLFHPKDFDIVKNISTNVNENTLNKIKSLSAGNAIAFGTAFKIPVLVKMNIPDPLPKSTSLNLCEKWY